MDVIIVAILGLLFGKSVGMAAPVNVYPADNANAVSVSSTVAPVARMFFSRTYLPASESSAADIPTLVPVSILTPEEGEVVVSTLADPAPSADSGVVVRV
ncbi:hypothetical protein PV04_08352 [Phialophora macrospora]|uniref:Secreted protein n=1 Tax=Phialophora macrospora TaxID=1851006 RepID=A0A0D2CLP0_9EURO|nr:hypothetical protein PV04_08352 [Phialophora macrospora]